MKWFDALVDWWWDIRNPFEESWDSSFPFEESWDSSFPEISDDLGCPDTEPTSPGALDSDLGRLR